MHRDYINHMIKYRIEYTVPYRVQSVQLGADLLILNAYSGTEDAKHNR